MLLRLVILTSVIAGGDDEGEIDPASLFDVTAHAASCAIGVEVVPRAELLSIEDDLRECAAELACIARTLRDRKVDLALSIIADIRTRPQAVTSQLIDSRSGAVIGRKFMELDPSSPKRAALESALASEVNALFEGTGHPIGGRVIVETTPGDASVAVGDALPATANTFTVVPGQYVVLAKKPGYEDAHAPVTVVRGAETKVAMHLEPSSSVIESPWLWLGVAGAAAGAVTAVLLIANSGMRCHCIGSDPDDCRGCP